MATHRGLQLTTALLVASILGLAILWWCPAPPQGSEVVSPAVDSPEGGPAPGSGADALPDFVDTEVRAALDQHSSEAGVVSPAATDNFDALFERLVAIAVRAHDVQRTGDATTKAELDTEGREVLRRILLQVEDSDQRALFKLTGLPSEDSSRSGLARRHLCLVILRHGLEAKRRSFELGGSRNPLDHLVRSMLTSMPQDEAVARDLAGPLTGTPYMGVAHEIPLLDLVALAAEERHLVPLVTDLLQTLWDNLQAVGARSSEELAHLALVFRADGNRAKRLAALRYLLTADDGRFRDLVLHDVLATGDEELVSALTMTVATRLSPAKAMATLERLSMVTTRPLMAAFLAIGGREPGLLTKAYEAKLALGTRPDFRSALVTGAGFQEGSAGVDLARIAFAHDPDPGVRARALFVLSSKGDSGEAERAVLQALDDPTFSVDPARIGDLVLALENLAAAGATNAVARIGARLERTAGIHPKDRQRLLRILRRGVPETGGAGSRKEP